MSEHELRNRLKSAVKEFDEALAHNFYNYVISEDIKQSAAIIDAIAHGKHNPHQDRGVGLIHRLQDQLQQKLSSYTI